LANQLPAAYNVNNKIKKQKGNRIFTQKHLHKAEMLESLFNHFVTILITYRWRMEE